MWPKTKCSASSIGIGLVVIVPAEAADAAVSAFESEGEKGLSSRRSGQSRKRSPDPGCVVSDEVKTVCCSPSGRLAVKVGTYSSVPTFFSCLGGLCRSQSSDSA